DRRARALVASTLDGEQRERVSRLGDECERGTDAAGYARDAADEEQPDREVRGERDLEQRRQQRERSAGDDERDAEPPRRSRRRRHAEPLQRLRRNDALGRARRHPAADERGDDAERTVRERADGVEPELRRDAGKVAAAEVTAEETQ